MTTAQNDIADDGFELIDRRAAIKKGVVGAGVAGAVWAAPKMQGLSFRPDYAAAASGAGLLTNVLPIPVPSGNPVPDNFGGQFDCLTNPGWQISFAPGTGGLGPTITFSLGTVQAAACLTIDPDGVGGAELTFVAGASSTTLSGPDGGPWSAVIDDTTGVFPAGTLNVPFECAPLPIG